ncbi:MAG: 50S ribosomal protein L29 [Candidatus Kerfeldbacteria bacterium]|nr:50S ribosomal protein L29 [Candidatus Kerfeldbacteria bacterium]
MDWNELKQKSASELQRLLQTTREQLRDRRFKVAQGQHKDVREVRELKHDIARLMTRIKQVEHQRTTS